MKRIAITQRIIENQSYPETRDGLAADWGDWIQAATPDAVMMPVPNRADAATDWWTEIRPDALILSGGNDWGEAPARDDTERRLLDAARQAGTPVFAVCRGLQAVNACFGGAVIDDVAARTGVTHVAQNHGIELDKSPVSALAGSPTLTVNSFHDQGVVVDAVAPGFQVFAVAKHGIVEGMFHQSEAIVAVQWHPERTSPSAAFDVALFNALLEHGAFWTDVSS
ncbi:MAG: C26 family cysteine hydrolase domain-containing family [Alphaproteobacteria bacterium]|jgi:N5-(cytidine 5'-diphosphoramidyl)-L-glutamine hydrolase|nr:C26 family cysteine hydrolase domain-containing family [Alphaproteobacteria bacterium]MBT5860813.1 C26 family cysteine hydrolase domain-containing family [Alphaproteobacteria bacterium]